MYFLKKQGGNVQFNIIEKIKKTIKAIPLNNFNPAVAIISGSGLDEIKNSFTIYKTIKYADIPYFPKTTVQGHIGELLFCSNRNANVLIFNGRFHYYEGFSPQEVIYPVQIIKFLGIKTLILTAAAGGLNKIYREGDIVVVKDHINFTGNNPLIGHHCGGIGERFPDMNAVYNKVLIRKAVQAAKKFNIKIHEGVYFGVSGPSYETPSEVKAYSKLGGDIVGMSIVYEAIAAAQMKIDVLGLVYVSNMAAGLCKKALNHREVLKNGKKISGNMAKIIKYEIDR
jgi:purine-nucleoside phosphorylase